MSPMMATWKETLDIAAWTLGGWSFCISAVTILCIIAIIIILRRNGKI